MKTIYLAGGCYWGTEHFLKQIHGVLDTTVGFANGNVPNPTYKQVCTHTTGFAETVCVHYEDVALEQLLELYFMTIDPTSVNRQGEDEGDQYRTGIYYTDPADLPVIQQSISQLAQCYEAPIVIEVEPLRNFYPAHDDHQDYLDKNPHGYCHINPELFVIAKRWKPKNEN